MQISAWAIRNPIPVSLLFIILLIAGLAGYRALPIKLYPDVSFPVVQVTVTLAGGSPTEVESQVTREVEAALSNVTGVKHLSSVVSLGISSTAVEFEVGEDPQRSLDEVRAAVDRIRSNLPRGIEEPIVERFNIDKRPIVTYAVSAPAMSDVDLSWFVDNMVARRLASAEGVARVQRVGGVEREINVTLDPSRLEALGLTAPAINNALRAVNLDAPGGRSEIGGREQTVRVLGAAETVETLRDTVIPTGDGRQVRLGEVAVIASGAGERTGFALVDDDAVVAFQVMKTKEASDIAVEDSVAAAIAALRNEHPEVQFRKILSTAKNTRDSFTATIHTLIEGMVLAAIVVFFFLRDLRSTIIAAVAMPLSLIPTFAAMALLGFSLNLLTLLALTLVIGILVDDAIVEIENIQKRIEAGETPYAAASIGADSIGLAVVATTMTIVAVFVPVSFLDGVVGRFFREFGLTVALSVMCSLIVARLLTPLMAAYFMKAVPHAVGRKPFNGWYRRLIEWALAHRWKSLGAGVAIFVGSLCLAALLPTGFTAPSDNGIVEITIEGAPGATLDDMRKAHAILTRELRKEREVERVFSSAGSGGDLRSGAVTVLLKEDRNRTTQKFQADIRPVLLRVPDVRLGFGQSGGGGSSTVQILLASEDGDSLAAAAASLEQQMRSLPELANVHQITPPPTSELVIRLKPDEAARLGVTAETIASIARVSTSGDIDANSAKFNQGEQRLNIRVRLPGDALTDLDVISNLRVPTAQGLSVPLSAVADLAFQPGVARIERFDRERRAIIEAELNNVSLGEATRKINDLPILKQLPQNVRQPAYGQAEDMMQLFASFGFAMLAGIGLMFGVLVLLFGSFFKPITILMALPLSLSGAFLALLAGGAELNLPAMIGFLMLMGLAAKNSILLVEHAIESERAGVSRHDALIEACRERARPIVMTTFAMAAGMVPTALGLGEGSEMRVPMALAVIGGLVSSTALSLILVPVVYEFVDDWEVWLSPRLSKLVNRRPTFSAYDPADRTEA
ncbi:efflux RND transporter permease subunit [Sphingopyxis fribergensis]